MTNQIPEQQKDSAEIEELKQSILECRGLYKGCKIDETTAHALASHLHHVANYCKAYLVEKETAASILLTGKAFYKYYTDKEIAFIRLAEHIKEKYGVKVDE